MTQNSPEGLEREADSYTRKSGSFIKRLFVQPNRTKAAELYVQAAHAYGNANRYEKAAELFGKAGEIFLQERGGEMADEAVAMFIKSAETFYLVNKEKAIGSYRKAFEINTGRIMDFPMAAMISVKMAKIHREMSEWESALKYFHKAAELYGNAQMRVTRRNNLIACAEIELKLKRYENVFKMYQELAFDDSVLYQSTETTFYLFVALLSGVILNRIPECYGLLNKMDHDRTETKVSYRLLGLKEGKEESLEELDREILYYKNTNSISREASDLLRDVRASIDPVNDIL
jgi:tetratricopeptide (TPR) repeat protein